MSRPAISLVAALVLAGMLAGPSHAHRAFDSADLRIGEVRQEGSPVVAESSRRTDDGCMVSHADGEAVFGGPWGPDPLLVTAGRHRVRIRTHLPARPAVRLRLYRERIPVDRPTASAAERPGFALRRHLAGARTHGWDVLFELELGPAENVFLVLEASWDVSCHPWYVDWHFRVRSPLAPRGPSVQRV
jgi:hypothetical protein